MPQASRSRRLIRFDERLIEIITALKVITTIAFLFAKNTAVHHVEDDFAKILTPIHAPLRQDSLGHRAKLLECELA